MKGQPKTIWEDYNLSWQQSNDFLRQHGNEFSADLRNAGADEDEIEGILDLMWNDDTFYTSANEALEDYREYHKETINTLIF